MEQQPKQSAEVVEFPKKDLRERYSQALSDTKNLKAQIEAIKSLITNNTVGSDVEAAKTVLDEYNRKLSELYDSVILAFEGQDSEISHDRVKNEVLGALYAKIDEVSPRVYGPNLEYENPQKHEGVVAHILHKKV